MLKPIHIAAAQVVAKDTVCVEAKLYTTTKRDAIQRSPGVGASQALLILVAPHGSHRSGLVSIGAVCGGRGFAGARCGNRGHEYGGVQRAYPAHCARKHDTRMSRGLGLWGDPRRAQRWRWRKARAKRGGEETDTLRSMRNVRMVAGCLQRWGLALHQSSISTWPRFRCCLYVVHMPSRFAAL